VLAWVNALATGDDDGLADLRRWVHD